MAQNVIVENPPRAMLTIVSGRLLPTSSADFLNATPIAQTCEITVMNTTAKDIVAFAIHWLPESSSNVDRRSFSCLRSSDPLNHPVLKAGHSRVLKQHVSGASSIKPVVDVIMFADGSAFGRNESMLIEKFQTELQTREIVQKEILDLLRKEGSAAVLKRLEEAVNDELLLARFLAPRRIGSDKQ
jgi:hypothetical protein